MKLLSIAEVADMLGVPVSTIYQWVHLKRIPHVKLTGRTLRFDLKKIEDWLAERAVHNKQEKPARTDKTAKNKKGRSSISTYNMHNISAIVNRAKKEVLND